jgi:flagellar hook-basal body complex protein FliE
MTAKPATLDPALAAYAQAVERLRRPDAGAAAGGGGPSFAEMVAETLVDAVETNRRGEVQAMRAATGSASLQEVVEAVNAAELSLQTVVALRDRMIAAYQEIMRMPI